MCVALRGSTSGGSDAGTPEKLTLRRSRRPEEFLRCSASVSLEHVSPSVAGGRNGDVRTGALGVSVNMVSWMPYEVSEMLEMLLSSSSVSAATGLVVEPSLASAAAAASSSGVTVRPCVVSSKKLFVRSRFP